MYEDAPVLTQREITQQIYAENPDEVNHDISVKEDKGKLPTYVTIYIIDV